MEQYNDIIQRLVQSIHLQGQIHDDIRNVLLEQKTINRRLEESVHDMRVYMQQQTVVNTQNTTLVQRISRTLDLIEEKLERIFPSPS
jgi:hypothetical protein